MIQQHLEKQEALKKLTKLVDEVKVCMFATIHTDYSLYSRPMQTIKVDEEGNLWFFTNEYSEKVDDVSKDNTVYLMYSHPGNNTYLHIKGECSITDDKDKIKELWSPAVKVWFPKGLEDPSLTLLKVNTSEASYWDGTSSKFIVFYNIIKAIATSQQYDNGEYGNLKVS